MKTIAVALGSIVAFALCAIGQDANETSVAGMPPGMSGSYGTEQAIVLKVFAAEDGEARFRAYQVKWKDQDVIVSDMMGATNFKEGDKITFMVQNIQMPVGGKKLRMLQFMIMDFSSFMPKQGGSNQAAEGIGAETMPQP
ncbi:MAG: hypothetical protein WC381_04470 [Kiritimatiellia bacterium]|jgi:hypothetical protein